MRTTHTTKTMIQILQHNVYAFNLLFSSVHKLSQALDLLNWNNCTLYSAHVENYWIKWVKSFTAAFFLYIQVVVQHSDVHLTHREKLIGEARSHLLMCHAHQKYSFGWIWTAVPEQYELREGTSNTPVNTCQRHIIIAENQHLLTFQKILYDAVPLHPRVESRYSHCKRIILWVSFYMLLGTIFVGNDRYCNLINYYTTGQMNM